MRRGPTPVAALRIARAIPPQANPVTREVKATCADFERAQASIAGRLGPMTAAELATFNAQVAREYAKAEARRAPALQLDLAA
jgi:hypothetical protein